MRPYGDASTRSQACLDGLDAFDGQQRAEDLLLQHGRILREVGGERGGGEVAAVGHVGGAGGDPPGGLRGRGVARDALLGLALDHRRHVDLGVGGLADVQHLDRARQPLDQPVVDRLVREHARGRRALLARVVERGLHERGDDVVEVGVGVHDHAVLAAHLGHDTLQVPLAGRHLGGAADDLEPDRPRAGERDRVHARVADELRADRALAGQQRQRGGGNAGLAQRAHEHVASTRAPARRA